MNAFYPKGRQAFATGQIDWEGDTIKATVLVAGYTYSDAHDYYDDVTGAARLFEFTLAGRDATDGILDADDHDEAAVAAGDTGVGYVIWKDTGSEATSPLLFYVDRDDGGAPLSVPTAGGVYRVRFPNGPTKIVRL